jgi:hypothetical protein
MLDPDAVRNKGDEVEIRTSQDDQTIPRIDRRLCTSGRGLTCHDMPRVA